MPPRFRSSTARNSNRFHGASRYFPRFRLALPKASCPSSDGMAVPYSRRLSKPSIIGSHSSSYSSSASNSSGTRAIPKTNRNHRGFRAGLCSSRLSRRVSTHAPLGSASIAPINRYGCQASSSPSRRSHVASSPIGSVRDSVRNSVQNSSSSAGLSSSGSARKYCSNTFKYSPFR